MSDGRSIGKMLFMIGGLLVWTVHFTVVYGFTTVACVTGLAAADVLGVGMIPVVIGAATVLACATTAAVLISAMSGPIPPRSARYGETTERFLQYAAATIAALSFVAIAWTALPVLLVTPC